jgi:hypothetical protein
MTALSAVNRNLELLLTPVYSGALAPEHRLDLERSGLTDATIQTHGLRSVPPGMIGRLLGWGSRKIQSAYILPYADPRTGGWLDHVVLRLFPPIETKTGTLKYAQPRGTSPRLYVPRPTIPALSDPVFPLWFCEGQKKSLALAERGYAAVGMSGIEGWHRKGETRLLPDFYDFEILLEGRAVSVIPDADAMTNENVERGVERLVTELEEWGARARVLVLPGEIA